MVENPTMVPVSVYSASVWKKKLFFFKRIFLFLKKKKKSFFVHFFFFKNKNLLGTKNLPVWDLQVFESCMIV